MSHESKRHPYKFGKLYTIIAPMLHFIHHIMISVKLLALEPALRRTKTYLLTNKSHFFSVCSCRNNLSSHVFRNATCHRKYSLAFPYTWQLQLALGIFFAVIASLSTYFATPLTIGASFALIACLAMYFATPLKIGASFLDKICFATYLATPLTGGFSFAKIACSSKYLATPVAAVAAAALSCAFCHFLFYRQLLFSFFFFFLLFCKYTLFFQIPGNYSGGSGFSRGDRLVFKIFTNPRYCCCISGRYRLLY